MTDCRAYINSICMTDCGAYINSIAFEKTNPGLGRCNVSLHAANADNFKLVCSVSAHQKTETLFFCKLQAFISNFSVALIHYLKIS